MRALAKDPADRYQSAEEMDADLERFARGAAVSPVTEESATQIMRLPVEPYRGDRGDDDRAAAAARRSCRLRRRPSTTTSRSRSTGGRCGRGSRRSSSCSRAAIGGWFLYREISNKLELDEAGAGRAAT